MIMSYQCSTCGEIHEGLPDIGADKPDMWWMIPEEERDQRINLSSDTCIINDKSYFIRGIIEIPILDQADSFGFGVWVSQKKENFFTYLENFDSAKIGPVFGWLCTRLGCYEQDTTSLKTMAHFYGGNQRPRIVLEPSEHPLAVGQHNGVTLKRAWDIVHYYLD